MVPGSPDTHPCRKGLLVRWGWGEAAAWHRSWAAMWAGSRAPPGAGWLWWEQTVFIPSPHTRPTGALFLGPLPPRGSLRRLHVGSLVVAFLLPASPAGPCHPGPPWQLLLGWWEGEGRGVPCRGECCPFPGAGRSQGPQGLACWVSTAGMLRAQPHGPRHCLLTAGCVLVLCLGFLLCKMGEIAGLVSEWCH